MLIDLNLGEIEEIEGAMNALARRPMDGIDDGLPDRFHRTLGRIQDLKHCIGREQQLEEEKRELRRES